MLIEFSIENFRSIKDSQTFSMEPISRFKESMKNIAEINHTKLLKSSVIYGKNASGKTNVIFAFKALSYLVSRSSSFKVNDKINCYEPYDFDKNSNKSPITFNVVFLGKNKVKYNYTVSFTNKEIVSEDLIYYPKNQPANLFSRNQNQEIKPGEAIKNKITNIEKNLFKNQLFLSKISTEKVEELIDPFLFFDDYFYINTLSQSCNLCDKILIDIHKENLFENKDSKFYENINKLVQIADTGINGIIIKENKEDDFVFPETIDEERKQKIIDDNKLQIFAKHDLFENGEKVGEKNLDLKHESSGTNRLVAIGGIILDALTDGTCLIIDELEKSLHPYLTKILIELFNNPKTNPHNAQLIFTTHDVSLLTAELFRRDQVWFADKDDEGKSSIYSLGDIKGVRKDVPYHKYYLKGIFGGVPNVNFYDFNFEL
jgi:AAA15 family ATPase/GTPase